MSKNIYSNMIFNSICSQNSAGDGFGSDGFGSDDFEAGVATKNKNKTKRPSLYRVLLLNDDYTPMDFVIYILQDVFNKHSEEAVKIMLLVHTKGKGEAGVFPYEIAETKVAQVMDMAIKNSHPLKCVMEKQ